MSSFNILLTKKCPGGDIEQVTPVGSLEVPVLPSLRAAGAVLMESTGLSRQRRDQVQLPREFSAAGLPADS